MSQADIGISAELTLAMDAWRQQMADMQAEWEKQKETMEGAPINIGATVDFSGIMSSFEATKTAIEATGIDVPVRYVPVGGGVMPGAGIGAGGGATLGEIIEAESTAPGMMNTPIGFLPGPGFEGGGGGAPPIAGGRGWPSGWQAWGAPATLGEMMMAGGGGPPDIIDIPDAEGDYGDAGPQGGESGSYAAYSGRRPPGGGGMRGFGRFLVAGEIARMGVESLEHTYDDEMKARHAFDTTTDPEKAIKTMIGAERDEENGIAGGARQGLVDVLKSLDVMHRPLPGFLSGLDVDTNADNLQTLLNGMKSDDAVEKHIRIADEFQRRLGIMQNGDAPAWGEVQQWDRVASNSGIDPRDADAVKLARINDEDADRRRQVDQQAAQLLDETHDPAKAQAFKDRMYADADTIRDNDREWINRSERADIQYRDDSYSASQYRLAGNTDEARIEELRARQNKQEAMTPEIQLAGVQRQDAIDMQILQKQIASQRGLESFESGQTLADLMAETHDDQLRAGGNTRAAEDDAYARKIQNRIDLLRAEATAEEDVQKKRELSSQADILQQQQPQLLQDRKASEAREDADKIQQVNDDAQEMQLRADGKFYAAQEQGLRDHYQRLIALAQQAGQDQLTAALQNEETQAIAEASAQRQRETNSLFQQASDISAGAGLPGSNPHLQGAGQALSLNSSIQQRIAAAVGDPAQQRAIATQGAAEAAARAKELEDQLGRLPPEPGGNPQAERLIQAYESIHRDLSLYGNDTGLTPENVKSRTAPYMLDSSGVPQYLNNSRFPSLSPTDPTGARLMREWHTADDWAESQIDNDPHSTNMSLKDLSGMRYRLIDQYLQGHYKNDAGQIENMQNHGAAALGQASGQLSAASAQPFADATKQFADTMPTWQTITDNLANAPQLVVMSASSLG